MSQEEYSVEVQSKARHIPSKIRMRKRTPLVREYIWTGGAIPREPDTSSFETADVVTNFVGGKLTVIVKQASQWTRGGVSQAAADAVARAVGGWYAKPV